MDTRIQARIQEVDLHRLKTTFPGTITLLGKVRPRKIKPAKVLKKLVERLATQLALARRGRGRQCG